MGEMKTAGVGPAFRFDVIRPATPCTPNKCHSKKELDWGANASPIFQFQKLRKGEAYAGSNEIEWVKMSWQMGDAVGGQCGTKGRNAMVAYVGAHG